MNILLGILLTVLISFLVYRWIRLAWHKLHDMAGIEVGMSQYSVQPTASPAQPKTMRLAYRQTCQFPIPLVVIAVLTDYLLAKMQAIKKV
ncbi:MAG: hypothetical protein U1E91_06105 [Moraxella sp.]